MSLGYTLLKHMWSAAEAGRGSVRCWRGGVGRECVQRWRGGGVQSLRDGIHLYAAFLFICRCCHRTVIPEHLQIFPNTSIFNGFTAFLRIDRNFLRSTVHLMENGAFRPRLQRKGSVRVCKTRWYNNGLPPVMRWNM